MGDDNWRNVLFLLICTLIVGFVLSSTLILYGMHIERVAWQKYCLHECCLKGYECSDYDIFKKECQCYNGLEK